MMSEDFLNGKNIKHFLIDHAFVEKLVDFAGIQLFENATVDAIITIFANASPSIEAYVYNKEKKLQKEICLCLIDRRPMNAGQKKMM